MRRWGLVIAILVGWLGAARAAQAVEVAIVVNHESEIEALSFVELVKIFRHTRQYWGDEKIELIMREAGSPEQELVLMKIYQSNDEAMRRFWFGKLYRGEITTLPKALRSDEAIKWFVSHVPTAIGFIDAASVDARVKVLSIDGRQPGEPGYALASEP